MRIKTIIHRKGGLPAIIKNCKEIDGKLMIKKPNDKKKKSGWMPIIQHGSIYQTGKLFKHNTVDVLEDADKTIVFNPYPKESDMPKWDKHTSKQYIEAEVLKNRGRGRQEKPGAIIFIIIILQIITLGMVLFGGRLGI